MNYFIMPLDRDIRLRIEESIDELIKDPKESYEGMAEDLAEMGIQPNLETTLAFITGFIYGLAEGRNIMKRGRVLNASEKEELFDLLRRRSWELRQEFVKVFYR